jgi:hypothetical protein
MFDKHRTARIAVNAEDGMDTHTLQKWADCNALVRMPKGNWGVKVLLQYHADVSVASFRELKRLLEGRFQDLAKQNPALMIDIGAISVAARTVEGTLLIEQFDNMRKLLEIQQIHIQIRAERAS